MFQIAFVFAAVSSVSSAQPPARPTDLTGKWSVAILTTEGPQSRSFELKQAADGGVTGSVSSPYGDIAISKGRASRDSLTFEFSMAGGQIKVEYLAVIRNDSLQGVWRQTNEPLRPFLAVRGVSRVELPPSMIRRGE
jgi:hypothetical protein